MKKLIKFLVPLINTRLKSVLMSFAACISAMLIGAVTQWLTSHGFTDADLLQKITECIATGVVFVALLLYHVVKNLAWHEITELAVKVDPAEAESVKDITKTLCEKEN